MTLKITRKTIFIHLIFWLGYYALLIFVFTGREIPERAWRIGLIHILPQMVIAYANMEWLIPRYFIKRQYYKYALGVLACFVALYGYYEWINPFLTSHFVPPSTEQTQWFRHSGNLPMDRRRWSGGMRFRLTFNFTQTFAIFFLSTAYKVFQIAQVACEEIPFSGSCFLDRGISRLNSDEKLSLLGIINFSSLSFFLR